jgi:hypothetical protein
MLEIIIIGFVFWLGYEVGMGVTAYRLRHLVYKEAKRVGLDLCRSLRHAWLM